jgi:hypothetical protein
MRPTHLIVSGCVSTVTTLILLGAALMLLSAVPAAAATKPAAVPAKAVAGKRANAWPPETLSGTITSVDPHEKVVVVKGPDGVPFDMVVIRKTQIRSGDQKLTIADLAQYQNKSASVRFVPERRGDVAESVQITQ